METRYNPDTKRWEWVINSWWGKWIYVGGFGWWIAFGLGFLNGLFG
jgi:hypothetical protein